MNAPVPPPGITGQTGIGSGLSRTTSAANLQKAGTQFEAMFDGLMLKAMRKTRLADPLFDTKAIDTFTELGDARLAQSMAEHQPIGIGRAMTDFLQRSAKAGDGAAAQPSGNQPGASLSP